MDFSLTILGSNSAVPNAGRHLSAQVLHVKNHNFLIDCGEGTQFQFNRYHIKRSKLSHIFISHLHGDHYFGLIGLLTSMNLFKRKEPLSVYAPKGLEEIINVHLSHSGTIIDYDLIFHETNPEISETIVDNDIVEVITIPLKHRIPCCGFLIKEKPKPRKIIAAKIEEYNIPYQSIKAIKAGEDLTLEDGGIIKNDELTEDPVSAKSYAYCSDTMYHEPVLPIIQGVDVLYHEATFAEDLADRAVATMHSTAAQAATIAKKANAKKLILGHFSSRYIDLKPLLKEAQAIFPNTYLAEEGAEVEL